MIGATVEQDPSLLAHPLFGLFAEPASTVILTTAHENISKSKARRSKTSSLPASEPRAAKSCKSVDREPFIDASLEDLRTFGLPL